MIDYIDSKEIFSSGPLSVTLYLSPDPDSHPRDFECYSEDDYALWKADEWLFVGVTAVVRWHNVEMGTNSIWSVEHGTMDDAEVDAFDMTEDSPAHSTVAEALGEAQPADTVAATALNAARQEFGLRIPVRFLPATNDDERPAVRLPGGALVFVYERDGRLQISVDLDDVATDTVPITVACQGDTVWSSDQPVIPVTVTMWSDGEVSVDAPRAVQVTTEWQTAQDDELCACGIPCYRNDEGEWTHREGYGFGDDHAAMVSE